MENVEDKKIIDNIRSSIDSQEGTTEEVKTTEQPTPVPSEQTRTRKLSSMERATNDPLANPDPEESIISFSSTPAPSKGERLPPAFETAKQEDNPEPEI